ncbi:hypothetical protein [Isorropodon fossajaponicum symbiont]|uniref:hypothetical protein n=1 Tax=Isorropodon fossajaponicum symbiont TaxID=883811 RepID=UPI0019152B27|nr:hypothetical protein [Isorropodon fossajaponicum symbiont]
MITTLQQVLVILAVHSIDYGSRISTLENSGGSSPTFTIADNPIIYVNCSTGSLQQAIKRSPLHGKVIIEISGTCTDDIYLHKSLTIRGNPDDGVDTVTGDASGFSSAAK